MTEYFCGYCKEPLDSKERFADHLTECSSGRGSRARKATELLSRKMMDKRKRKKAIVLPIDLSGKGGEFPESESEELKSMLHDLNTYYEQKIPSLVGRVMSSLRLKRLRGPNGKWWKQHYLKLLGVN
jgi:hypothetical protein